MTDTLPHIYLLLAAASGIPTRPETLLKVAGLWTQEEHAPMTDHQRSLLRMAATDGRLRWVSWGPEGKGYVLTGLGEAAVDVYHGRYGPAPINRDYARQLRQRTEEEADHVA